jgi:glutathione S-transferase
MIEFFQITGSASFAVRMALEEAGAEYEEVNIHPRRRDEPASFAEVNPLRRVPALRDGDVTVYETGAVLLVLADRFPVLGPPVGTPERADLYRWILWLAATLPPRGGRS